MKMGVLSTILYSFLRYNSDMSTQWVKARAECTLRDVFRGISARLLKDVSIYNRLDQQKEFMVVSGTTTKVFRAREVIVGPNKKELSIHPDHTQDFVELRPVGDCMVASRNGQWQIELEVRWNEEKLTCELMIDGEILSDDRVSQRLIGDFMFEE